MSEATKSTSATSKASRSAKVKAVAYMRTSSAANVGGDKDSEKRQRLAIERFAKAGGYVIAGDDWFYDPAVSGADQLATRPGWQALMARILSNGVRTVIIEDASRFARELMIQEQGIADLKAAGVTVMTANGDDLTASNDPGRTMIRQIMGSFSEYEKAKLVHRLKSGRDRRIAETGRCGGKPSLATTHPEAVALAKRLHRAAPSRAGSAEALAREKPKRMSLRAIADKLAEAGHTAASGKPFSPSVVKRMLES